MSLCALIKNITSSVIVVSFTKIHQVLGWSCISLLTLFHVFHLSSYKTLFNIVKENNVHTFIPA